MDWEGKIHNTTQVPLFPDKVCLTLSADVRLHLLQLFYISLLSVSLQEVLVLSLLRTQLRGTSLGSLPFKSTDSNNNS